MPRPVLLLTRQLPPAHRGARRADYDARLNGSDAPG